MHFFLHLVDQDNGNLRKPIFQRYIFLICEGKKSSNSSERAQILRNCTFVKNIIRHVGYAVLMDHVNKVTEKAAAHLKKQLVQEVTGGA